MPINIDAAVAIDAAIDATTDREGEFDANFYIDLVYLIVPNRLIGTATKNMCQEIEQQPYELACVAFDDAGFMLVRLEEEEEEEEKVEDGRLTQENKRRRRKKERKKEKEE